MSVPQPAPPAPPHTQAAAQRDPTSVPQLLTACVAALGEAAAMRAVLVSIGDALQQRADPSARCGQGGGRGRGGGPVAAGTPEPGAGTGMGGAGGGGGNYVRMFGCTGANVRPHKF